MQTAAAAARPTVASAWRHRLQTADPGLQISRASFFAPRSFPQPVSKGAQADTKSPKADNSPQSAPVPEPRQSQPSDVPVAADNVRKSQENRPADNSKTQKAPEPGSYRPAGAISSSRGA